LLDETLLVKAKLHWHGSRFAEGCVGQSKLKTLMSLINAL